MAETNAAPSPNFSTIDFNPSFFTTSTLTVDEADALYLNKTVADTANVLETFAAGIQSTTATITSSLEVLGVLEVNAFDSIGSTLTLGSTNATTVTTNVPFYANSVDSVGSTLTLGSTNATSVTTTKPFTANSVDSVGSTLTLGSTNATTITTSKPFTANSYSLTGSVPTLSKTFLSYFVNYASISEAVTTTGIKYLYTPAANSNTSNSHYFNAGVYEANINCYVVQTLGPTFSGCAFTIGVASGTATGTLSKTAQYGTYNVSSPSFSVGNPGGVNLNGNGCVFSHTACLTLASSAFLNLELFISSLTAISAGTVTFTIYGCVKRIA